VRNNSGGNGGNANKLFSYFIDKKMPVKYEVFKTGPGPSDFSEPLPFYIKPAGITYNKKVVVLTNRACFSACNDFALYMSLLPNVTLVGDSTGGGGGNPNNYVLANGWKLQYTATLTLAPDKRSIESGIAPDETVAITSENESAGKDPIIDRALELLQ
jgi:C-terminal processing protease CtpA/Prc